MSAVAPRKKSPRAPSIALDEALDRALKAYDKERLHPAPTEVVAQNLGYKTANSGSALGALASLRYYGLIDRPKDGLLAVTKDVEAYKFSPDEDLRQALLIGFLRRPPLFSELLAQYESGLPSDANIRYELIQRGFLPPAAEVAVGIFRRSVDFAGFFSAPRDKIASDDVPYVAVREEAPDSFSGSIVQPQSVEFLGSTARNAPQGAAFTIPAESAGDGDQIPVRLPGGRRAWLVIPTPFYEADKTRLKAQIDLLLTQDEEDLA